MLNVVAFPFWIVYTTLLSQKGWVSLAGQTPILVYVIGISIGTMAGLWVFVRAGRPLRYLLITQQHRFDRFMGLLFVGLSVFQSVSLIRYVT
ncbi:hypothetical protein GCM10023187_46560 [Nibrella viscosa]|uniref:LysE type translocator n=1 Tax=Nibrella viscosa TaxID=1084524 RepID=A0ABP8KTG4_9BACT